MRTDDASSESASESEVEEQVEWLATTREKRSTAGNRLSSLLQQEEPDDELELLFQEDEDDEGFEDEGDGDQSDVQMDSSSDEEDQGPTAGADDLEGEKELERQNRAERLAKKRKLQDGIPKVFRKKVKIDPTAQAPAPRPKKKSERASWIPAAGDMPTRASARGTTKKSKEQLHEQMVHREIKRLKQLANMEKAQAAKAAAKKPPMTQADRLREAARVEKQNAKSLNRWEEAEQRREEEQRAKLEALNNRQLEGPVITWWSGLAEWVGGKLKKAGNLTIEPAKEKPPPKKRKASELDGDSQANPSGAPPPDGDRATKDPLGEASVAPVNHPEKSLTNDGPADKQHEDIEGKVEGKVEGNTEGNSETVTEQNGGDKAEKKAEGNVQTNTEGNTEENGENTTEGNAETEVEAKEITESNSEKTAEKNAEKVAGKETEESVAENIENTAEEHAGDAALRTDDTRTAADVKPEKDIPLEDTTSTESPHRESSDTAPKPQIAGSQNVPAYPPSVPFPSATAELGPTKDPSNPPFILAPPPGFNYTPYPYPSLQPPNGISQPISPYHLQPNQPPPQLNPPQPSEPPGPPPPPSIEHTAINYLILSNFEENAIKNKDVQTQILFNRKFPKAHSKHSLLSYYLVTNRTNRCLQEQKPPEVCVITAYPAKFRDPATGLPYYNAYAYREIQKLKRGEFKWSKFLGAYVGMGTYAARGVPARFLNPNAPGPVKEPAAEKPSETAGNVDSKDTQNPSPPNTDQNKSPPGSAVAAPAQGS